MSLDAFELVLSAEANELASVSLRFPLGNPYSCPATSSSTPDSTPTAHEEKEGFGTGDRFLANSILFKTIYSWWIEASYVIPEGDIGQVWEVMKVKLQTFTTVLRY